MKKVIESSTWIKSRFLPIILVILGAIDQSTNLLIELLKEVNAPIWIGTLLRILVMTYGSFKLFYAKSPSLKK